jgi:hypothetical protein
MSGLMQSIPNKICVSLNPSSGVDSNEAEMFARARFLRVLQSWAVVRLVAKTAKENVRRIRKAA